MLNSKRDYGLVSLLFASTALFVFITYFTERYDSVQLILLYSGAFLMYIWTINTVRTKQQIDIVVYGSIAMRLSLLFALPNLSDDLYRFVWDGRLLANGINPFSELPSYYLAEGAPNIPGNDQELYDKLNSPEYFTIYPPVAQLVFWITAKLSPTSVWGSGVIMRSFIILVEIGNTYLIRALLKRYGVAPKHVLLYALNPLVILELSGNLHFEAFMIFFSLLAAYLLHKGKWLYATIPFALAIASKLIPLIFLPLIFKRLAFKKLILFYLLTGAVTALLFLPLLSQSLIDGMTSSVSLYFQKFEFNASVYYVVREIGYAVRGYNIIQTAGKYMALITFIIIIGYALLVKVKKVDLLQSMMWVLLVYFLMTTTLHPWYVATLLALSVFTRFKFSVIWTFLIFLTYAGYTETGFQENLTITIVEYLITVSVLVIELIRPKQIDSLFNNLFKMRISEQNAA
ncbi:MAG: hypothetical protein AAFX87_00365 [Bacteroidota bacterium]